jgi:hypothetical protein
MTLVNEIVNARPNSKLGGRLPAELFTKTMSGDEDLIEDVSESILKSANAKRQPSKIVPYSKGDRVRVIDEKYLASKLRSNKQKLQARWSKRFYTIWTVKSANSDTGFMPEYILTINGNDDEYRSDPVLEALAGHDRARALANQVLEQSSFVGVTQTPNRDSPSGRTAVSKYKHTLPYEASCRSLKPERIDAEPQSRETTHTSQMCYLTKLYIVDVTKVTSPPFLKSHVDCFATLFLRAVCLWRVHQRAVRLTRMNTCVSVLCGLTTTLCNSNK